jgi:hypothetical protein
MSIMDYRPPDSRFRIAFGFKDGERREKKMLLWGTLSWWGSSNIVPVSREIYRVRVAFVATSLWDEGTDQREKEAMGETKSGMKGRDQWKGE